MSVQKIIITKTDEAPELSRQSEQSVFESFLKPAGIEIEVADISLAGRILQAFTDQKNDLEALGGLVKQPGHVIIKLPNISASVPQLKAAIAELQSQGHGIPDYEAAQARYKAIQGSVVNPVLRNGNSLRKPIPAAKAAALAAGKSTNNDWSADSLTGIVYMKDGGFRNSEKSVTVQEAGDARIEFVAESGEVTVLKEGLELQAQEVIDASVMSRSKLRTFLAEQMAAAKEEGTLFSLHMKATMMKVSDPIIFGHAVEVYFADVFEKHAGAFAELGVNPNNGLGDVLAKIGGLADDNLKVEILADIKACYQDQPDLYMVNSDEGITNFHVPSDVIIDASIPAVIKAGGVGWDKDGKARDTRAVIPDGSYAPVYEEMVRDCKENGAFDSAAMGSVTNIGLMAGKAEEYGSHDKTFEMQGNGLMRVVGADGGVLLEHAVEQGDIWRMCQVKDAPIRNWIELAITESQATGDPVVFWLDETRPHDAEIISRVKAHWAEFGGEGAPVIMAPAEATRYTNEQVRAGRDVIAASGNVLRDYLTDLYPILELGTSAKMLSIVSMLVEGGQSVMLETGAGGTAPKHIEQFMEEGHLRWNPLGEIAALSAALKHIARVHDGHKAQILADTLDAATVKVLKDGRSPSRKVGELDTRGMHFYLALYWAQALAVQEEDAELNAHFAPVAVAFEAAEADGFIDKLNAEQGSPVDLGGYYHPDEDKVAAAMSLIKSLLAKSSEAKKSLRL